MDFRYQNYRHKDCMMPKFWPDLTVQETGEIKWQAETLEFFERFNALLATLPGYGPMYRRLFAELGDLEGYDRIRFFRGDTGTQYTAMCRTDGRPLNADGISNCAFMLPYYSIDNPRAVKPIRIEEGSALHLWVDADFKYRGEPLDAYEKVMSTYSAELA